MHPCWGGMDQILMPFVYKHFVCHWSFTSFYLNLGVPLKGIIWSQLSWIYTVFWSPQPVRNHTVSIKTINPYNNKKFTSGLTENHLKKNLVWTRSAYKGTYFACLNWFFTSQSTIFQLCPGHVLVCWTSTKQGLMHLAQGHNAVKQVRLKPTTHRSWHSTTEPLRSR